MISPLTVDERDRLIRAGVLWAIRLPCELGDKGIENFCQRMRRNGAGKSAHAIGPRDEFRSKQRTA